MTLWRQIIGCNNRFFARWKERSPLWWSNALAGEAGEVCNAVKHLLRGGSRQRKVTPADVAEECVDTLIYMVLLCESLGITERDFSVIASIKLNRIGRRIDP